MWDLSYDLGHRKVTFIGAYPTNCERTGKQTLSNARVDGGLVSGII